jgi:hypothetical protein
MITEQVNFLVILRIFKEQGILVNFLFILFFGVFFWDRVSLYKPGWPWTFDPTFSQY